MTALVVRCRIRHLHELMPSLRDEEQRECIGAGIKPRHAMMALWKATPEPWAAVDEQGRVLAVWGDAAPVLARIGWPWVFTSAAIERAPLFFFREVRRQLQKMLDGRDELRCDIMTGCTKALRFYEMIGFEIDEPVNGFRPATIRRV